VAEKIVAATKRENVDALDFVEEHAKRGSPFLGDQLVVSVLL
jgi:hypothetical protein